MTTPIVTSITDEQLAELERTAFNASLHEQDYVGVHTSRLESLIARLREAEKNAARWRCARKILEVRNIQEGMSSYIEYGMVGSEEYNLELDQAIDAAMEQSK